MSGISSVGSSSSTTYYSPLDTNQDGIVDTSELEAATQSGLLAPTASTDEDGSDPSAADKFSGSLTSMLLQQMQQSATAGAADGSETDAKTLSTTLDTENAGMLNEGQFSQSVDVVNGLAGASASSAETATPGSGNALEAFLAEMQASMTAYQNTYGQYDLSASATDSAAA